MPDPPIGGVHATELVIVHLGAFETCRPGSWNKALVSGFPPAPTRLFRYLVSAKVTPAFHARSVIGRVKTSTSTPWLFTPALVLPVQAPVAAKLSVSAPFRLSLQLLMFSTTKLRPLNVFNWKFLNSWWKRATFTSIPCPLYLAPSSRASTVSGLNLSASKLVCGSTAPLPPERARAARSRLKLPAL